MWKGPDLVNKWKFQKCSKNYCNPSAILSSPFESSKATEADTNLTKTKKHLLFCCPIEPYGALDAPDPKPVFSKFTNKCLVRHDLRMSAIHWSNRCFSLCHMELHYESHRREQTIHSISESRSILTLEQNWQGWDRLGWSITPGCREWNWRTEVGRFSNIFVGLGLLTVEFLFVVIVGLKWRRKNMEGLLGGAWIKRAVMDAPERGWTFHEPWQPWKSMFVEFCEVNIWIH